MDISEIKKGMIVIIEGTMYQVVDFLHVKPGKGAAFMNAKLKNVKTGSNIDRNYNTNTKIEQVSIERKTVQYLYNADGLYYFMDNETYEQFELSEQQLGSNKDFLIENSDVDIQRYNGELLGIILPDKIEMTIVSCDPGVKGNTQSSATKDAKTETGLAIRVPLFINEGEKVIISTSDGKYYSRA